MDSEKFFKEMYYNIWQSNDLNRFDDFYAKDFQETICFSDENKQPFEVMMNYENHHEQAILQRDNYKDTTIDIKKIVTSRDNHISVNFYSSSIYKKTGELRHRCLSGIWALNGENKINRVWAVVTPYYAS